MDELIVCGWFDVCSMPLDTNAFLGFNIYRPSAQVEGDCLALQRLAARKSVLKILPVLSIKRQTIVGIV